MQGQGRAHKKPLKLPALTDRNAVQVAIHQVLDAISSDTISQRSAGQLLFGLQIASGNFRRAARPPKLKAESYELEANSSRSASPLPAMVASTHAAKNTGDGPARYIIPQAGPNPKKQRPSAILEIKREPFQIHEESAAGPFAHQRQ
jgi:hypothetical protein